MRHWENTTTMAKNRDTFTVRPCYVFCQKAWHPCTLLRLDSTATGERIVLRFNEGPAKGKQWKTGDAGLIAKDDKGKRRYRSGQEIVA